VYSSCFSIDDNDFLVRFDFDFDDDSDYGDGW
jgi:hypothetical protein